jgi:hypothetical protein
MRAHDTAHPTLRKKLKNNAILMRRAVLGRIAGLLPGTSVLYISMINDATMEENKLFCKVIVRYHDLNAKSAMRVASYQENH